MITSTRSLAVAAATLTVVGLTACTATLPPRTPVDVSAAPTTENPATSTEPPLADAASGDVDAQLLYLIEEEKLAHDVYTVLGDLWGGNVFTNIAPPGGLREPSGGVRTASLIEVILARQDCEARSRMSSRTRAASAWPFIAFMTAPMMAPAAWTLPSRIFSSTSG